jgi:hypothetical protein
MPRSLRSLLARGRAEPRPTDDDLELWNAPPADGAFVTGNGLAHRCGWSLNYGPPRVHESGREGWYFCKTDFVDEFFERHAPDLDFVLFTHNSDLEVGRALEHHLDRPNLRAWFAANAAVDHPKLRALAAGIANPRWPHGDTGALRRVQETAPRKSRLFDASFSVDTNPSERGACVEATGITPAPPRAYRDYLRGLASAFFCLAPRGNGIDTHRTWEALYVRTIPVVTRSLVADHHRDLPLIVLDEWSDFGSVEFSADLYERTIGAWSSGELSLDAYVARIEAQLAAH